MKPIKANQFGAIDSLVFSDKIIQTEDEEKIIEFLEQIAEAKGAKTFSARLNYRYRIKSYGFGRNCFFT